MTDTIEKTVDATRSQGARIGAQTKETIGANGPLQEKVKDVMEGAAHRTDTARNKAEEWTSCAVDLASGAKDQTQEIAAAVAEKAIGFSNDLSGFVRRYPVPTLLVGIGVGFLIVQALRRCQSN